MEKYHKLVSHNYVVLTKFMEKNFSRAQSFFNFYKLKA